ncbi:FecR family protein [Pseudomonas sp. KFB-139]|uniref:FecR family protein n=1 Tax=Pseudomonas serbiensis TaxID=3064350 RepID=A0ABT9CUX3_9PSED|nr:FecR family protein [Pseudomonas sp. KFB-138]MDO7929281.1 FecR family protein [Pseudomonas sp. KFB-138]
MSRKDDALEQAGDWQIRLQEEPEAREAFEQWLQASPEHRAAWLKMEKLWGALGDLPVAPNHPAPRSKPKPKSHRLWTRLALAAGIAAVAVLVAPQANLTLRADYHTGVGETRTVQLADGSTITLSPQSALSLVGGDARKVELLQGQAYFQVAPDPQHPFIAQAGQLSVRVLGTAFDLDLQEHHAEVALEHGQVQAENTQPPLSERLMPGQRLRFSWPSGKVERSRFNPAEVASWRSGSLFVENQTVAEITDRLQRYTSGWIVIADPALKQRRITGVFDLNNPDRALKALAQSLAVETRQVSPWVHVMGNF